MRGDLVDRTRRFAIEIIRFADSFPRGRTTEIISRQLVRAATAVGANYRAACRARSRADFISKITIVEEESDEVAYWLEIVKDLNLTNNASAEALAKEANELTAIFVASAKTAKRNA